MAKKKTTLMASALAAGAGAAVLLAKKAKEEEQKKGMEKFLCEKYNARKAHIEVRQDASVLGGFILRVGSDEYDWSVKGRLDRLAQSLGAANI